MRVQHTQGSRHKVRLSLHPWVRVQHIQGTVVTSPISACAAHTRQQTQGTVATSPMGACAANIRHGCHVRGLPTLDSGTPHSLLGGGETQTDLICVCMADSCGCGPRAVPLRVEKKWRTTKIWNTQGRATLRHPTLYWEGGNPDRLNLCMYA